MINGYYLRMCGAEVYGQKIGVGDRVQNLAQGSQDPGYVRRVYRYTREYIIYVWEVEKLDGRCIVKELLAIPVNNCRLSFFDKIVYRLPKWILPSQSLTYITSPYQLRHYNSPV